MTLTKKTNHMFQFSDHSGKRACLAAVAAGLLLTSCFFHGRDVTNESLKDSVTQTYVLKDKRHVEIKYEKLVRSYTPYSWLSGISQPSTRVYGYIVVTATIKSAFGRDKVYRWIDAYPDHTVYFTKLDGMVFTDDDVFVKYTYIPAFPADDYRHYSYSNSYDNSRNRNPFGGNPRLLVKYGRYTGAGSLHGDQDDSYRKIDLDTYKWPKKYVWDEVSRENFDRAARSGDVIRFDTISSNGNFDFYFMQTRPEESIYYYGKRKESGNDPFFPKGVRKEVDYYDYYSRRLVSDQETELFLSSVKTRDAKKVEELLNADPALIHSYDPDGMTALHLALLSRDRHPLLPVLYKFNPQINAIDYKGRTPLKVAFIAHADKTITDELIKRGGKVLWDDCSSQEEALNAALTTSSRTGHHNQNENVGEWLGDAVYQVWMEADRSPRSRVYGYDTRQHALFEGRGRIIGELGLRGTADAALNRRIELILDNAHIACSRLDKNARTITNHLVRICAPGLKNLVVQYNTQKKF